MLNSVREYLSSHRSQRLTRAAELVISLRCSYYFGELACAVQVAVAVRPVQRAEGTRAQPEDLTVERRDCPGQRLATGPATVVSRYELLLDTSDGRA